jgi:hypothetical protein
MTNRKYMDSVRVGGKQNTVYTSITTSKQKFSNRFVEHPSLRSESAPLWVDCE